MQGKCKNSRDTFASEAREVQRNRIFKEYSRLDTIFIFISQPPHALIRLAHRSRAAFDLTTNAHKP